MDKLDEMYAKQKELMARVPHGIRKEVYPSVQITLDIIEDALLYLNSLGHKPWRPNPLNPVEQLERLDNLARSVGRLKHEAMLMVNGQATKVSIHDDHYDKICRNMISVLGMIEESVEYMNSVRDLMLAESAPQSDIYTAALAHKREEGVDIEFFWLEAMIQGGFSPEEIYGEYMKKWAINIKRYEDAAKGDFKWDKRAEGKL